jgi:hypothetical protein
VLARLSSQLVRLRSLNLSHCLQLADIWLPHLVQLSALEWLVRGCAALRCLPGCITLHRHWRVHAACTSTWPGPGYGAAHTPA